MTTLQQAQALLERAESEFETSERKDGNAYYRSLSERHYSEAAIYAAVAQAEALTRLAEVAEELLMAGELDRAAAIWGRHDNGA